MNLQAELAYIQARLSTLQPLPLLPTSEAQCPSLTSLHSSSEIGSDLVSSSNISMNFEPPQPQQTSIELTSFPNPFDQEMEDNEFQALAQEFASRYLPGFRFRPSTSS